MAELKTCAKCQKVGRWYSMICGNCLDKSNQYKRYKSPYKEMKYDAHGIAHDPNR